MKIINEKEVQKEANSEKHFECKPSSDFVVGFTIGNSWTETKLEELAIEFSNDCLHGYKPYFYGKNRWYRESDGVVYTTSQLFELFINEMNKK